LATTLVANSTGDNPVNPANIVKQRIATMEAMGKSVGVIVDMIKGKTQFDHHLATQTADEILDFSFKAAKQFTKPDQSANDTRALPAIWQQKSDFDLYFSDLQDATELLAQVAAMNQPDILRPKFAEVVEICSACHEKFRKPKQ
jgi:cytochrome c556